MDCTFGSWSRSKTNPNISEGVFMVLTFNQLSRLWDQVVGSRLLTMLETTDMDLVGGSNCRLIKWLFGVARLVVPNVAIGFLLCNLHRFSLFIVLYSIFSLQYPFNTCSPTINESCLANQLVYPNVRIGNFHIVS